MNTSLEETTEGAGKVCQRMPCRDSEKDLAWWPRTLMAKDLALNLD